MSYDSGIQRYEPAYRHDDRRAEYAPPTTAIGSTHAYYSHAEAPYAVAHAHEERQYAPPYPRHYADHVHEPEATRYGTEAAAFGNEQRYTTYPQQEQAWPTYKYAPHVVSHYAPAPDARPDLNQDEYSADPHRSAFPVLTSSSTPHQPRPPSVTHSAASWDYSQRPYAAPYAAETEQIGTVEDGRSYSLARNSGSNSAETALAAAHDYARAGEGAIAYPPVSDAYVQHVPDRRTYQEIPLSPPRFPMNVPPRRASLDGPPPVYCAPEQPEETYASTYDPLGPISAPYRQPDIQPAAPPTPLSFQHYPQRPALQPARLSISHASDREPSSTLATLQEAFRERAMHNSSAPILAFNPAREPSASGKQLVETDFGVTYAVAGSGQSKGKVKSAEVIVACKTCDVTRVKCIMRGADLGGWMPRVNFKCLDCLPPEAYSHDAAASEARDERLAARAFEEFQQSSTSSSAPSLQSVSPPPPPQQHEHDSVTFRDTFSGAVDEIVRSQTTPAFGTSSLPLDDSHRSAAYPQSRLLLAPEETARGLSASFKRQALCCDVCSRIVGAGSIESLSAGPAPAFTVESICRSCLERYRPCSDCGGGGGRLTPGRWRCKGACARRSRPATETPADSRSSRRALPG